MNAIELLGMIVGGILLCIALYIVGFIDSLVLGG